MKNEGLLIGLLGVVAGLLVVMTIQLHSVPAARGQAAPGGDSGWLMATGDLAGSGSCCWLFNTKDMKMGLYTTRGSSLSVSAIRSCVYDFQLKQYGKGQKPSVEQMQKTVEELKKRGR